MSIEVEYHRMRLQNCLEKLKDLEDDIKTSSLLSDDEFKKEKIVVKKIRKDLKRAKAKQRKRQKKEEKTKEIKENTWTLHDILISTNPDDTPRLKKFVQYMTAFTVGMWTVIGFCVVIGAMTG